MRALGSCIDDLLLSPSAGLDCSRIARDIAAVSPFRSDSKTLKSFTDCSIEVAFVGEVGVCWMLGDEGLSASWLGPGPDMLVERCGFFLERLRPCPGALYPLI